MADQLPMQDVAAVGAVAGMAGVDMIAAAEAAVLAAGTFTDVGGGSYKFHPDELKSVIDGWQDVIHTLSSGKHTTHTRTPESPAQMEPGNENASSTVSQAAHATNQAYQNYLASALAYAQGMHDKLTTAYNNYMTNEQTHADAARSLEA